MGGFFKNNPEDTVVGSTDATEDTINETAVTETDSTSSFYRGSPEQTTVDGYVADASGHAASAEQYAEDAEDSSVSASYFNSLASQQVNIAQSAANQAKGYRDSALQHKNSANISTQGASQHAYTASGYADDAAGYANNASQFATTASGHATTAGQHATSASNSASSIVNLTVATGAAGTSASYDAATGVLTIPAGAEGEDGNVYVGSYDENTGKVNFINTSGTNFSTGDLRGEDGSGFTGGSYDSSTGIATFTSDSGLGFSTSDLRGEDGTVEGAAMLTGADFTGDISVPAGNSISTDGGTTPTLNTSASNVTKLKGANLTLHATSSFHVNTPNTATIDVDDSNVFTANRDQGNAQKAQVLLKYDDNEKFRTTDSGIDVTDNITLSGTVDGRDVAADGARLDTMPYHRVRYDKCRHTDLYLTLTSTHQNISQAPNIISPATPVKCARYIDIQTEVEWRYVSTATNDLVFRLEVVVPISATVTNLGSATNASNYTGFSSNNYENWFWVSGDKTHLLTEFGRMNKTGVSNATELIARAWYYDPALQRTYILTESNPGISVSTGDTVYWHPYAWEAAGTTLYVEEYMDERYVSNGRQNITLKFKTAYDDSKIVYRALMREVSSGDSAVIYKVKATLTDVEEV